MTECEECGARYADEDDGCAARFDQLLALDHSRREPWGSRHGQAFAAYVLQHPRRYPASVASAWEALYRIYCLHQQPERVFAAMRGAGGRGTPNDIVPPAPRAPAHRPLVTIADLGDFSADTYPSQLDKWCRETLRSWGAPVGEVKA